MTPKPPGPSKLQRWLDLISFLVGRRLPVTYEELMSGVPAYAGEYRPVDARASESLRRKFERDKQELRDHGIPIRTISYSINYGRDDIEGYILDRRDFYLPYLRLVTSAEPQAGSRDRYRIAEVDILREEAPVALEALRRVSGVPGFPFRAAARSAFRKLAFDMDPEVFGTRSPVLFIEKPGAAELAARVRTLSDALLARKRIRFRYHGIYRDEVTTRDVAPYGLLFQHGNWYLVGLDALRDATRIFRVGRMDEVTANTGRAGAHDYEIPDDFSLDHYADREAWELGDPDEPAVTAHVRFPFPLSLWVERNAYGELVEQRADGSQVRAFVLQQVSPFLRWLLGLEGEAEILEPAALQQDFRELAAAVARAHGGRGS